MLAALLPWTPLLAATFHRKALRDPKRLFLLAWAAFVLIAFSISVNKLPGYILPALPAIAALIAIRLDEPAPARWLLASCGLLLAVFPIAAQLAPAAFLSGLSHAPPPHFEPVWLFPIAIAAAAWELDRRGRRLAAVAAIAAGAAIGIGWLKTSAAPQLDRYVSARGLWRQIEPRRSEICIGDVKRDWDYGLAYYAGAPLPDCAAHPLPLQIVAGPRNTALLRPKQ